MVKVLHVLSDTNFGGAGQYVVSLLKLLEDTEVVCKVVLPLNSKVKASLSPDQVVEIDGIADKSFAIGDVLSLMVLFRREKPQVVHTHAVLSARIAARLLGIPCVFTKHTHSSGQKGLKLLLNQVVQKLLATHAIAISQGMKQELLNLGFSKKKITTIYNGVVAKDQPTPFAEAPFRVLLVGRFEPVKGYDRALRIIEGVCNHQDLKVTFAFAGVGSQFETIKSQAQALNLPIDFLGHVSPLDEAYKNCHVLMNTSYSEAMPFALLEAMNWGRPVIGFDVPGVRELIMDGETGYLIKNDHVDAFAQALLHLAKDAKVLQQMGANGHAHVKAHYTLDDMKRKFIHLYKELS